MFCRGTSLLLCVVGLLTAPPFARAQTGKTGEVNRAKIPWPQFELQAEDYWRLSSPKGERFDASGLLRHSSGDLLCVNDRGASLYRIELAPGEGRDVKLIPLPECFNASQLAPISSGKVDRWDCEGIAEDALHRLYLCEEANRWIIRFDTETKKVERLEIDWSPVQKYFDKNNRNASFEGIAIGAGNLYVANERQTGRIIVVNLATAKVIDHFTVYPDNTETGDTHYSDLCWFEDSLWALLRENDMVVKINPSNHAILAAFKFGKLEKAPEFDYAKVFPTSLFEGLSVDEKYIWLVTDNNGMPLNSPEKNTRPTLVRCLRPDKTEK